jgi:hypothetical protein
MGVEVRRPSRSTVKVAGQTQLANGKVRTYPETGQRIEVCYPCRRRWERKGSLALNPGRNRLPLELRKRALKLLKFCSVAQTARALNLAYTTVRDWNDSTRTQTPSSSDDSKQPRKRPPVEAEPIQS